MFVRNGCYVKPGDHITIAVGFIEPVRLLRAVVREDEHTVRTCDMRATPIEGFPIDPAGEGSRWCRGWEGPQVDALGAVAVLLNADRRITCTHNTPPLNVHTRNGNRQACSTCGTWL